MKKILLGITGSIAAYKSADLSRLFVNEGYEVYPVLSAHGQEFITTLTMENLTGHKAYTDESSWNDHSMAHIELKESADLYLIAPATANILAKCANGIADEIVSTTFLSVTCPVLFAPAMNPNMYSHPATQQNIAQLKEWGASFVEPDSGLVACGDEGKGKLADITTIFNESLKILEALNA